ncbi:MAG: HTTM domain-containing protein [Acidimicrobiales bacterium]
MLRPIANWFDQAAPPERLAMFRILLGLFTLSYLLARLPVFLTLADGRPGRFEPVGVLSAVSEPLPSGLVYATIALALGSALAFAAGWRFRLSGPVLAVAMLVLGTYRSSWGQLLHFENLLVLHLLIVGFSPAADVWSANIWSVNAWSLDRQRLTAAGRGRKTASSRYGWPLKLAALTTTVTYVLAGVAKLRYGEVDWLLGDTLRNHVAYTATRLDLLGGVSSPLARPFVAQGWLSAPAAVATVIIELAAPVAFLNPSLRRVWVLSAWLMHLGILGLMFIVFPYPLFGLAFAPLYELERLAPNSIRKTSSGESHDVERFDE